MNRLAILHKQLIKAVGGQGVPMLSIQGKMFTIRDGENEKNVSAMDEENNNVVYVDVHIVDASPYKAKVYYAGAYDPKAEPTSPTCFSDDGEKPSDASTQKQAEYCSQCPHNVWGSAVTEGGGRSKACRDAWKIAVVVPKHSNENVYMLRIPGGSLKNWLAYIAAFNDYPVDGEDRKMNASDVITRIYFQAEELNMLAFSPISIAEPEQRTHAAQLVEEGKTLDYIGYNTMTPEKREEVLALSAPSTTQKLAAPAKAKQLAKPAVQEQVEEEAEVEEAEGVIEEDDTPLVVQSAPKKAFNTILNSEMRTKAAPAKVVSVGQPKPNMPGKAMPTKAAAPAEAKASLTPGLKNLLGNVMKLKTTA